MGAFEQNTTPDHATMKIASVWFLTLFTSWADFAAFLAAMYSLLLIGEFVWKKFLRPYCEMRGWVKRSFKRRDDYYR